MDRAEWRDVVDELRVQWKSLWRTRIDDKVRAEGVANKDYSSLFVERGTVIVATKDYKPPDFVEILEKHKPAELVNAVPPGPDGGGWGKFARTVLTRQERCGRRGKEASQESEAGRGQRRKKGGRGWLHFRMK